MFPMVLNVGSDLIVSDSLDEIPKLKCTLSKYCLSYYVGEKLNIGVSSSRPYHVHSVNTSK